MPGCGAFRYEEKVNGKEHPAAEQHGPDADKEISQHLPGIGRVPLVINIPQRAGHGVGLEKPDFRDFMTENDTEQGVTKLVYRRSQPGHEIDALAPEGLFQRPEGEL